LQTLTYKDPGEAVSTTAAARKQLKSETEIYGAKDIGKKFARRVAPRVAVDYRNLDETLYLLPADRHAAGV
jgi:hypothetical protein